MPQHIYPFEGTDLNNQLPVSIDLTQPLVWPGDTVWQQPVYAWEYFNLDSVIVRSEVLGNQQAAASSAIQCVPSLFKGSTLQAKWQEPIKVAHNNLLNIMLGGLLLVILALTAMVKINSAQKIFRLFKSSIHPNNFRRFVEDYQPGWMPPVFTAYLLSLFIISGPIITWVFPLLNFSDLAKIGLCILLIIMLIAIPLVRSLILAIWGWVFSTRQLAMFHVQFSYVTLFYAAIFFTPFCLNYTLNLGLENWFNPAVMAVGLGCIWVYQLVRIWIQGSSPGIFSVFYLFVYLCTLEIVPLLLIFRLMSWQAGVE